jgi:hypothetical protein
MALLLGSLTCNEHLALRFKTNYIFALKTSISLVQILSKEVSNFYGLMETLGKYAVEALHMVDKVESVKGGILLASQLLRACDSSDLFQPAYERLSKALREICELNIAGFKADI